MTENNTFYCSFVSIHYIICECGETFPSEEALKDHLEKDKRHNTALIKKEDLEDFEGLEELALINEYKCGECYQIFDTEEECIEHQELTHVDPPLQEERLEELEEEEELVEAEEVPDIKPDLSILSPVKVISKPMTVTSSPIGSASTPIILASPVNRPVTVTSVPITVVAEPNTLRINSQPMRQPVVMSKPFLNNALLFGKQPVTVTVKNKPVNMPKERRPRFPSEKPRKERQNQPKNTICEVCGKKYTSAAALRYHQRVHTGVRPYQCAYCPKTFTMPLFHTIHQRIHTGEKPYACALCPKAFTNKAALLRHDRVHTGVKPYQCPRCGKSFSQSNSMKLHIHTVHLKLPTPYKSKKRRAEKMARDYKVKGTLEVDDMNLVKTEIDFPEINDESDIYYCDLETKNEIAYEIVYQQE